MARSLGRRFRDGCLTAGGIGAVLGGIAAIDPESRRYLVDALHGQLPPFLADLPVQHVAQTIANTIPISSSAGVTLVASALVLFVLMFRT